MAEASAPSTPADPSAAPSLRRAPTATTTCWICQQSPGEDGPDASPWRRPCPCTATAHERCLLDWHDSLASPTSPTTTLQCPMCKHQIQLSTPRRPILTLLNRLQRYSSNSSLLFAGGALMGILHSGSMVYGINALKAVFGSDRAEDILRPSAGRQLVLGGPLGSAQHVGLLAVPFWVRPGKTISWGAWLTVPLIAPTLVALRLEKLGRYIGASLPLIYMLYPSRQHSANLLNLSSRLSPGEVFFCYLPIVHELYTMTYATLFAKHERKWELAMQRRPREGETAEDIAAAANGNDVLGLGGFGGVELELQMGVEVVEEVEDDEEQDEEVAGGRPAGGAQPDLAGPANMNADLRAPPVPADEAQQDGNIVPGEAPVPDDAPNAVQGEPQIQEPRRRQPISAPLRTPLLTTMTALFFPAISSLAGDVLLRCVPHLPLLPGSLKGGEMVTRSWWIFKWASHRRGWWVWEEKWARTVLGGCLVIVLRDAIVLWGKWRRAGDWSTRTIKDYQP